MPAIAWRTAGWQNAAVVLAFAVLAPSARAAHEPHSEFIGTRVAEGELRFIVKTARYLPTPDWAPLIARDACGWLVCVAVSEDSPFAVHRAEDSSTPPGARYPNNSLAGPATVMPRMMVAAGGVRVIGPLWTGGGQALMLDPPAIYAGKQRRQSLAYPPAVLFDDDGTVVRVRVDPRRDEGFLRDRLEVSRDAARWVGEARYVGLPGTKQAALNHGRLHVQRSPDGAPGVHDFLTGGRLTDAWLHGALAAVQARQELTGIQDIWLTHDGQYLVFNPENWFAIGHHDSPEHRRIESFEVGGRTYSRSDYIVYFARPDDGLRVAKRESSALGADSRRPANPWAAFSIDGKLYLLNRHPGLLRLTGADGGAAFEVHPPWREDRLEGLFRNFAHGDVQHFADQSKIVVVSRGVVVVSHGVPNYDYRTLVVREWNYRSGKCAEYQVAMRDVFDGSGGSWKPKVRPIPVQ